MRDSFRDLRGYRFRLRRTSARLAHWSLNPRLISGIAPRCLESGFTEAFQKLRCARVHNILNEELDKLGWTGAELAQRAKGDVRKVRLARRLRAETAATLKWIATELHMGTWTHVANRLSGGKQTEPTKQTELNLCQK